MIPKQFRIHVVLIISVLAMILVPMIPKKVDPEKAQAATTAAMQFLELVDTGGYTESWQTSAALLKETVTEKDWTEKLSKARTLSGAMVERKQDDLSYSTTALDSPDGEYIMMVFVSSFERAASVEETLTVMLEEDHRWRVAGYFMQ